MKKSFTICMYSFITWLNSTKIVLFAIYFTICYWVFISPYKIFAIEINSPMEILEPFLILESLPFAVPLIPLLMLVWLSDIPLLVSSSKLVLYRIGKKQWFFGQIIFVFMIALIFQLTIFILSVLAIANNSFFANGYSLVLRHAAMGESNITSSYTMNGSVLNQIRPFELFFNSFTLNLLYMITIGIIQYCFTLCSKRILGIILNFIIVGGGFCLLYIDSKLKWLMPLAHSVYTGHYDTVYNRTYCDLKYSYLYFGIIIICLLTISYKITERCSFHCIEEVDV